MSFPPPPRSTIPLRRTTSLRSFAGPATSNFPVSPWRSAPFPRNLVFGNTVFFCLRPSRYTNSTMTATDRRERSGMSSPRLVTVPRRIIASPFLSFSTWIGSEGFGSTFTLFATHRWYTIASRRTARRAGPASLTHLPYRSHRAARSGLPAERERLGALRSAWGTICWQWGQTGTFAGIWIVQDGQAVYSSFGDCGSLSDMLSPGGPGATSPPLFSSGTPPEAVPAHRSGRGHIPFSPSPSRPPRRCPYGPRAYPRQTPSENSLP